MAALLDKLKVNGKPGSESSQNQASNQTEASKANEALATGEASKLGRASKLEGLPSPGKQARATDSAPNLFHSSAPAPAPAPAGQEWLGETQVGDSSSRPMTFTYPPGSTPLPRFTIRRGIGMGGFGEVYFAVSDAGKEVALKRIQRNLEVELRGVSHCLNLKHPNLVALYDICQDVNDQSWVVMEYVAGLNLRQVLDESPDGLPIAEVRRWFHAISSGVNHLHSAGLVHRDIKPGNVFDDLGIVKVGDYGLSKFISSSHRGGHTESVGTFHYMAPEIGRGQYGREIDIYALGILLYELLTGQVPFDGESCHEIIVKHLTATPELVGIDEPYRSTIARCLEKDPAKRFASVSEMMRSLDMSDASMLTGVAPVIDTPAQADRGMSDEDVPVEAILVEPILTAGSQQTGKTQPGKPAAASNREQSEPFARAVHKSWDDLNRWWVSLDRSPGSKVFVFLIAGFVLLVNTHWLLPMLSVIAVFYVPYYVVRQMVLHSRQQPTYAEAQRIATAVGTPQRVNRVQWRQYMRTDLRAKRSLHRISELNTSWIAASLSAVGLAVAAGVIGLRSGPVDAMSIAPYGWMAAVVLIASLGILGMGKLWERDEGEALPRRLALAGLGAGVGLAAYAVNQFLMLPLGEGLGRDINSTELPQAFYKNGVPVASAMMAHFAMLFSILRWWKPVDPLRRKRLSLWVVAVAVVAEWGVHQVLPIPQPAGMMIAGGIAIATQLSAPWINPRDASKTTSRPGHSPRSTADARSIA